MSNQSVDASASTSNTQLMTYGKYEGKPIADIDNDYLLWCCEHLKFCPLYIGYELVQRGYKRTKLPLKFRRRMKYDMKARGVWVTQTPESDGTTTVGEHYEWLRLAYLQSGGDESACPFGDDYSGPTLMYEDDEPFIYTPINKENAA